MTKRAAVKAAVNRARGRTPRALRVPVAAALAGGPMTAKQIEAATGIDVESLRKLVYTKAGLFRRANPDVRATPARPAVYELVPESERAGRGVCKRCRTRAVTRPRGLCWSCYYTPGVRQQHESGSPYARRGSGLRGSGAVPASPTDAPPGSREKMRVMHARALRGESLFHPLDNRVPVAELLNPFGGTEYGGEHDNGLLPDPQAGRGAA
jgi:hypothetical protein